MRRNFNVYLRDLYDAGCAIETFTSGLDLAGFGDLEEKQSAVERKFEIMGEAIAQCRLHHPIEVAELGDVQGVVDFRNYLAHRYHSVKADIVWDIVVNDLPPLMARVKALMQ